MSPWLRTRVGSNPNVAFVDVAARPLGTPPFVAQCRAALTATGCRVDDLDLHRTTDANVAASLEHVDVVFVTGGYPVYLLEWAQRSGFLQLVGEALSLDRMAYVGVSAGAALTGPSLEPLAASDDPGHVTDYAGLGLVDFVVIPHANRYPTGVFVERQAMFEGRFDLRPLPDDQAISSADDGVTRLASP